MIGEEPRLAYNRVLLSSVLAREVSHGDIELKMAAWWRKHGVTLLYGLTGETRYQLVADGLGSGSSTVVLVAVVVLVVVGLGFEVGAVPAHAWLPDVAQGAPRFRRAASIPRPPG